MNWLITGGCGFIGRAVISALVAEGGHRIRVLDNLSAGRVEDLERIRPVERTTPGDLGGDWPAALVFVEGDVREPDVVERVAKGAHIIVHLAANTGVFPSVQNPRFDCETNVFGVLNVLEACRARHVKRMVFASSGAPLGAQTPPLHEELAPHPASPYGASKLAGEGYCSAYYHCFGVESVVLRFGNVYGEGSTLKASVVAKFIKQALAGEMLEIYGNGSQTRDFIHIADLVNAIIAAATIDRIGGETFQIATSCETTVGELTELLVSVLESEGVKGIEYFNGEARQGDVLRNFSDTSKASKLLGWRAGIPLEEGLRRTVRSFLDQSSVPTT